MSVDNAGRTARGSEGEGKAVSEGCTAAGVPQKYLFQDYSALGMT